MTVKWSARAGDDERVEHLVEAEDARERIRPARGVDDGADRVEHAARRSSSTSAATGRFETTG